MPNYVTATSYTEDIPARTYVGDAQDKRTLAMMNLETGKTRVLDTLHDDAWVRELGGFGPNDPSLGFLPGERHIYSMAVDGGPRTKLTSMTGGSAGVVSPDDGAFGLIYSASTKPHEVYLMPNHAGAAATQVTTTPTGYGRDWRTAIYRHMGGKDLDEKVKTEN